MIESLTVDKAFIGTSAVDNGLFLSTPTLEKASLKRKFIKNANTSILLADSSNSVAPHCSKYAIWNNLT